MPETGSVFGILGLAFGLGLMHALDADHVMAVSGLSSSRATFRDTLRFCARWAIGHGLTLMLIGAAVLGLGMAIPERLSHLAEQLVGVVLIGIGLYVIQDLIRHRAHFHFHQHDGMPRHAHWHKHTHSQAPHREQAHRHHHGAVMVGMLHGTAGSAPLLALLPISAANSVWLGMAYLLMFGLGVLLAMLIFGGVLGSVFRWLNRWGAQTVAALRGGVALGSIGLGGYLLHGIFIS